MGLSEEIIGLCPPASWTSREMTIKVTKTISPTRSGDIQPRLVPNPGALNSCNGCKRNRVILRLWWATAAEQNRDLDIRDGRIDDSSTEGKIGSLVQ
jgi:hypothetical protein